MKIKLAAAAIAIATLIACSAEPTPEEKQRLASERAKQMMKDMGPGMKALADDTVNGMRATRLKNAITVLMIRPETLKINHMVLAPSGAICAQYSVQAPDGSMHDNIAVADPNDNSKVGSDAQALWEQFCKGQSGKELGK